MFLELSHTKLDAFIVSRMFVLTCYKETRKFPPEEKFSLTLQIRRASLSVHLNVAEGCSRKSIVERKRFYEIARGSLVEVDAALNIAVELGYIKIEDLKELGNLLLRCFQIISKMIS